MRSQDRYTPQLIENGRYRYEETPEPIASIALDFGVHERTMRGYAVEWGWKLRKDRPPRGLSEVARLLAEASAIPAPTAPIESAADDTAASAGKTADVDTPLVAGDAPSPGAESAVEVAPEIALVERMQCNIEQELSRVELMRAHLGNLPQTPADAQKTAQTLESLTRNLREVLRLRAIGSACTRRDDDDDDIPADIDEFRHALAGRIEAFIKSRTDL